MFKFDAPAFTLAISGIASAEHLLSQRTVTQSLEMESASRQLFVNILNTCAPHIRELPLSPVVQAQFRRLESCAEKSSVEKMSTLLGELHTNIVVELTSLIFLTIKSDRRMFYDQVEPPFGDQVQNIFPQAGLDIAAASRCYALDEWTACVFHLMRTVESGLKWLAKDVGLQDSEIEGENWKNVIDKIEKNIRALEQTAKGPVKTARTQALSEAAAQFRYFKDGWRNHVTHSLQNYDENAAVPVWDSVKRFMQVLSDPAFPSSQSNP